MNQRRLTVGLAILTLAILVGGVAVVGRTSSQSSISASPEVNVEIPEVFHEWGTIPIDGPVVEKTFTIRNSGSDILKLSNVQTSCMCTEAQVTIGNEQSPYFGMHGQSSWVGEVPPAQEALLRVTFDPAYHGPTGVGQITRLVSLTTNDSDQPKIEFTLTANVVKKS